ncbi:MAG: glycyl-radical enzyme activating protein [Bacteroidota bacterium]|nr:glycyl-radical enzyme activating protein [Bacteroidota bacterium]
MKALIFDIKRFAIHDGPGIRVTIFLKGCPLGCLWCHNPESRSRKPQVVMREQKVNGRTFKVEETVGREISVSELMKEILKEKPFMEESGGGVTFSGGEPLLQPEFLIEVMKQCREYGIHTAIDTTGYASSDVMKNVMECPDLFLYDLKHLDEETHKKFTGVSNKLILDNLKLLHDSGKDIVIRFPVIPGVNNDRAHIEAIRNYLLKELPRIRRIDLLPYHNIARHKYEAFSIPDKMRSVQEPEQADLEKLKAAFEEGGLEVSIGG